MNDEKLIEELRAADARTCQQMPRIRPVEFGRMLQDTARQRRLHARHPVLAVTAVCAVALGTLCILGPAKNTPTHSEIPLGTVTAASPIQMEAPLPNFESKAHDLSESIASLREAQASLEHLLRREEISRTLSAPDLSSFGMF
ncbi:MAG: hypothetical protein R3C53_08455 [Pirellulaceae bacterium]